MNTLEVERSPETLQCHQNCKAYLGQLESELETILAQQKAIANPKESSKLNVSVNDLRNKIEQVNRMLEFPPGSWVRNGSNKPGKVIDLVIAGKVPEVHVQWSGTNVPVPEQPLKLKLVEPADLEYIWNGDRFPKLVRRIDRQECNEIPVLQENLNRLQICQNISVEHGNDHDLVRGYQLQLTYCKKRIEYLKRPYRDRVLISQIRRDGGTQQRVNLNHEVVNEYAEAMRFGAEFPPIKLRYDGENYWLTDGFHTTEAAWSLHKKIIEAEITWGTQRDAILDSVGANASHGLRRSNADKRKAVTAMLEDEEWQSWSNREIARCCSVTEGLVRKIKKELELVHLNGCVLYAPDESTNKPTKSGDNKINSADNQDNKCLDKQSTVQTSLPDKTKKTEIYKAGQLVKLELTSFEGVSEQLKLANHSYAIVQSISDKFNNTINVSILGHGLFFVSCEDLKPVKTVGMYIEFTPEQFIALMSIYSTRNEIEDAIKKGVLGI